MLQTVESFIYSIKNAYTIRVHATAPPGSPLRNVEHFGHRVAVIFVVAKRHSGCRGSRSKHHILRRATGNPGSALSYGWDFGDGSTGTGASVLHAFAEAARYTAIVGVATIWAAVCGTAHVTSSRRWWEAAESTPTATASRTPTSWQQHKPLTHRQHPSRRGAGNPGPLNLSKLSIALNFAKPAGTPSNLAAR